MTLCIIKKDETHSSSGQKIEVKLIMNAQTYPDVISRNTVVEVLGRLQPNETVLVSGHLDSWDVTQGAMDDGGETQSGEAE